MGSILEAELNAAQGKLYEMEACAEERILTGVQYDAIERQAELVRELQDMVAPDEETNATR